MPGIVGQFWYTDIIASTKLISLALIAGMLVLGRGGFVKLVYVIKG